MKNIPSKKKKIEWNLRNKTTDIRPDGTGDVAPRCNCLSNDETSEHLPFGRDLQYALQMWQIFSATSIYGVSECISVFVST